MKTWYGTHKEVIQAILLLTPVVFVIGAIWYYQAFPAEYDKGAIGKERQTVNGQITNIKTDTQLVQRRLRDNLVIHYKVYFMFKVADSTYYGIQTLNNNWKNQNWVNTVVMKEPIPVEYSFNNPNKNRIVTERIIR